MCDTVVALGNTTKDGSILFAKNSDRQPNEPLLLIHEPKKTYPKHSTLRCTYIEIDQVEETHEIYMVKPSRSEERRVGKECRSQRTPDQYKKKQRTQQKKDIKQ